MAHTSKTTVRSKPTVAEKPPKAVAVRKPRKTAQASEVSPERRQAMIAEAAYLRAERRGFSGGDSVEDWLAAEREVDLLLAEHETPLAQ